MTKKRAFLLTVIAACMLMLGYAATRERDAAPKQNSSKPQGFRQEVEGFRLLGFSNAGVPEWAATGDRAVLQKSNLYRVFKLKLDVFAGVDPATGEQQALRLSSDTGNINQSTKEALLDDNVAVRLDKNTMVYTSSLRYQPAEDLMTTDKPVRLVGRNIQLDGTGLVVDLSAEKATVERDIAVQLTGVGPSFLGPAAGAAATTTAAGQEIRIRCTGKLELQRRTNCAVFHEDVEVVRGTLKLSADEMLVFFEPKTKRAQSLVASKNVTVRDKESCAKGTKLTWHAATQIATLYGDPKVSIVAKKITISAERGVFYQRENQVETQGGGYLVGPPSPALTADNVQPRSAAPAQAESKPVEIVWKGTLLYKGNTQTAVFSDDVQLVRGDVNLQCQELEVLLDDKGNEVKKLHAKENVRIRRGPAQGTGDRFTYLSAEAEAELVGEPQAVVKHQGVVMHSKVLRFFEKDNKTLAQGPGWLVKTSKAKAAASATTTTVHWQDSMVLLPDEKRAVFLKDVVVKQGDLRVAGNRLTAMFDDEEQLQRLVGEGKVRLAAPDRTGTGEAFDWQIKERVTMLSGEPRALLVQQGYRIACERFYIRENENLLEGVGAGTLTSAPDQGASGDDAKPTKVAWADRMIFDGRNHSASFSGRARVHRGSARLSAEQLTLLLDEQNRIQKLRAYDEVSIGDGSREAHGDALDWDWATDVAHLTAKDHVRIKEKGFRGTGKSARYYGKEGRLEVVGSDKPPQAPTGAKPPGAPQTKQGQRTTMKLYIDKPKKQ